MSENPLLAFAREVASKASEGPAPLLEDPLPPHVRSHPHALKLVYATKGAVCRECGQEFTGFEALVYVAKEWAMYASNRQAVRSHLFELERERKSLQAEVSKLRAQKKRLEASVQKKTQARET